MFPTHRKIVIVAGLVVLVAAGCARTTSAGVRRIELVATERAEVQRDPVPTTIAGALSSLSEMSRRGAAGTSERPATSVGVVRHADEQFIALVGAALSSSDLCALWDTLALVPLDARVPEALAQQMQLVTEIMDVSSDIVPGSFRDEWTLVADGFDEVSGLLAQGHTDAAIRAYDDPAFAGAQGEIADWMGSRCG